MQQENKNDTLLIARKEAVSFTGLVAPEDAVYIGTERLKNDSYDYFKTKDGKYYYQSDSSRLLEEAYQLNEREKKNRIGRK